MESIKNIYEVSRALFFITGFLLFFLAFCLHNEIFPYFAKLGILLLDLPLIFFAIAFFLSGIKLQLQGVRVLTESVVSFFVFLLFGCVLFFHFAYPDLI